MNTPTDEARVFLEAVYLGTDDNRIGYERAFAPDADSPSYRRIQDWAAHLAEGEPGVIMRRVARDGEPDEYVWYGVAQSERDLRRLGEELVAFVGPSVSNVSRERAALDPSDPVETAIADFSGGHAFRFQGDDGQIADALDLLFQARSRREARAPISTASPGLILRRFHMALVAGVPTEADAALRELRERALLTPLNLHFLQVQRHEAFAEWDALVADAPAEGLVPLGHLLRVRRPRAVTEALLRAVYYRRLADSQDAPDAFLEAFRSSVESPYAPLFSAPSGIHSIEALRAFMALAASTDDASLRDRVAALAAEAGHDDALLNALSQRVGQVEPEPPSLDEARRALQAYDFGRAFEIASALPASLDVAQILLECAYEVQSLDTEAKALEAVEALSQEDRDTLLSVRRSREAYESIAGDRADPQTAPMSWIEWIRAVLDDTLPHARAVAVVASGAREWTAEQLVQDGAVAEMVEALEDAATAGMGTWQTIQPALPHLVGALQRDPHYPRPELHDLYRSLTRCVSLADSPGDADFATYTDLLGAVLRGAVDAAAYNTLVDEGLALWDRAGSPRRLDWFLDTLEVLAVHAAPSEDARTRALAVAAGAFTRYCERATDDQLDLLQSLASEIGAPDAVADLVPEPAEERDDNPYAPLAGRRIAVYTLERGAAARVRDTLSERCPAASVELAHDKVCTDSLKALARNVDLFVVATGSATHSATDCIAQHHAGTPAYPSGKGSASILAVLRDQAAHLG